MIRRIFYSSDVEFIVYEAKGKTLTLSQHFQADEEGQYQFAEYLRRDLKTPVAWLVDSTQESYQINFLPHVFGWDKHNLLTLKKQRLLEYTSYSYATIQGRESQGRRDDRALFMGLGSGTLLQPWLDIVLSQSIPITSICSLPLLSQNLLKYFPESPYTLLVSHTPKMSAYSSQGLRQSFFLNDKLQLSRLIPLNTEDTTGYVEYVTNQIIKTQRYLESARLLPINSTLSVVMLTQPPFSDLLNKQLTIYKNVEDLQFHLIDNRELASAMGLETEETPLYVHHLVTPQLMRWWTPNHYARLTEIRYFISNISKLALHTLSLFFLAGGVIVGGIDLQKSLEIEQENQVLVQKKIRIEKEYRSLRIPSSTVDIQLIRNVVEVGRYLEAQHLSPEKMWVDISEVLNRHSELKIDYLEWGVSKTPEDIFQPTLLAKYLHLGGKRPPTNTETTTIQPATDDDSFLEGIRLYGEITSFHDDYQIALAKYNKFIRDLKEFNKKTWIVNPLVLPYQVSSRSMIKGTMQQQPELDKKAPFAVEILINHHYAREPL